MTPLLRVVSLIGYLESYVDDSANAVTLFDRVNNGYTYVAVGMLASSQFFSGVMIWSRKRAKANQERLDNDADKVFTSLTCAEDMEATINLCARLNIPLNQDTRIQNLLDKIEKIDAIINERWKCRFAFLAGIKNEGSSLHKFFRAPGGTDMKKLIMIKAELGARISLTPISFKMLDFLLAYR